MACATAAWSGITAWCSDAGSADAAERVETANVGASLDEIRNELVTTFPDLELVKKADSTSGLNPDVTLHEEGR